jgi:hypothetical protein
MLVCLLQVGQLRDDTPRVGGRLWQAEHVSKQQPVSRGTGAPVCMHFLSTDVTYAFNQSTTAATTYWNATVVYCAKVLPDQ